MKTIINTALVVILLIGLLFFMRRETEVLNGKIMKRNGAAGNTVEMLNQGTTSPNRFIE
jgi:hypothetical protein